MIFRFFFDFLQYIFFYLQFTFDYILIFLHFLVALSSPGITLKGRKKRQALHRGVMQKHIMTLAFFHPCVFALKTWQMETRTLGDFTAEIKGGFSLYKTNFHFTTDFSRHFFCLYFLKSARMLCIYILVTAKDSSISFFRVVCPEFV